MENVVNCNGLITVKQNSIKLQNLILMHISTTPIVTRDGRFGSKVGQICPKWDKSRAFSDQISVHLASPSLKIS